MAKVIMVQGTSSGVGKSVLTTALCRIFTQNGYKTAPFKSQNMSSNFHVLDNGDRMARSQAIAAYACNAEPDVGMNPILLIPFGKNGTEVIVNGKSQGTISSLDYSKYKLKAFDQALKAFERLSRDNDIIVVEGAGSPVEMNLLKDDIVNMGLAQAVNAPVILVSDISRGGVFASLYGTMMLFSEEQRKYVRGLVINKFMGDIAYFADGREIIERLCDTPVVGVIPYMDVRIEDEDSLADPNSALKTKDLLGGGVLDDSAAYRESMNKEFDRIAECFRANMYMEKIYAILNGGV